MKKSLGRKITAMLVMTAILSTMLFSMTTVSAYGPLTMYTPVSSDQSYVSCSPRTVQLRYSGANNGKMYSTWEYIPSGTPYFPIYESTNNGQTWTKVSELRDTKNGLGMSCCPQLFEMPQTIGSLTAGTLICVGMSSLRTWADMYLEMYKSTDLGRTWTYVCRITESHGSSDPIWEPFLMVYNNKLICYYSDERDPAHSQKLVHQTSTNGTTWGPVVDDVSLSDPNLRPGMPTVAKLSNGQFIMTYEMVGVSGQPNNYKISSNPESWNPSSAGSYLGSNGGSPVIVNTLDGRVVHNSIGSGDVFVNSKNDLSGSWVRYTTPLPAGYNRWMLSLTNGRFFIVRNAGFFSGQRNDITYADMALTNLSGSNKLFSAKSGKAVAISGAGTGDGNAAIQWTNQNGAEFMFHMVDAGSGYKKLVNVNSGKVLSIEGGSTADGAKVIQWTDNGGQDQHWTVTAVGSSYKIINRKSGKALDVNGASTADGASIIQWTYTGATNQLWNLQVQ